MKTNLKEYEEINKTESKKNRTLVLTKIKDSQCQIDLLRKKLSVAEKEKCDVEKKLERCENMVADANSKKKIMKKKLFKAEKGIKEIQKLYETETNAKAVQGQALKEHQKTLDDLEMVNEQLRQEKKKEQEEFTETLAKKEADLKKMFDDKLRQNMAEIKATHERSIEEKNFELRKQAEVLVHAKTMLAEKTEKEKVAEEKLSQVNIENQILRLAKADIGSILDKKEKELVCIKEDYDNALKELSKQQAVLEEKNQIKIENDLLRIAKADAESRHATEIAKKNEELSRMKNELEDMRQMNEMLKKEMIEVKSDHQAALANKDTDLKELKCTMEKLHDEHEKQMKVVSNKFKNSEKKLNYREVEIRKRLEEISVMKKKERTGQATVQSLKASLDKNENNLRREKNRIKSLIKERDAYKEEVNRSLYSKAFIL